MFHWDEQENYLLVHSVLVLQLLILLMTDETIYYFF
ncbi:unnamed protein product [Schistosoma curassoni]|uniref:Uncharacterized protein n=1 Tax=Schistosoma curassoni TaxID=6186 RepID=A0A183L0V1_9TREM|nr:unnamed protein product [Schistosoma curassoni]